MFNFFNLELPDFNNVKRFGILRWNSTYEIYEVNKDDNEYNWIAKEYIGNPKVAGKLVREYSIKESAVERIYTRDPKSLFNIEEFEDDGIQIKLDTDSTNPELNIFKIISDAFINGMDSDVLKYVSPEEFDDKNKDKKEEISNKLHDSKDKINKSSSEICNEFVNIVNTNLESNTTNIENNDTCEVKSFKVKTQFGFIIYTLSSFFWDDFDYPEECQWEVVAKSNSGDNIVHYTLPYDEGMYILLTDNRVTEVVSRELQNA